MKKFLIRWLGLSLLLHLVTAYFSVGYHSADEQFQILEFLSYKLGGAPQSVLAVEFPERMRPWLQPGIYYAMTRFWEWLGIHSFSFWAFSFRLFVALFGWFSVVAMAFASRVWIKSDRAWRFGVRVAALLWFLPALHARPSSESLAGSAFILAICGITLLTDRFAKRSSSNGAVALGLLACGALMGLSFESRFQMGLMIAGAGAWLLFASPRIHEVLRPWSLRLRWAALILTGFAVVFAIGRGVDHWGYGDWSFSPWNYFSYNLVRGEVSRYGRAPWWDLFRMAFTESWPFLGLGIALSSILAWILFPLQIFTWSMVPFFLIHEAIAHKELRFFFPIAAGAPVLLALLYSKWEGWREKCPPSRALALTGRAAWIFLVANNLVAVSVLAFMPFARTVQFYEAAQKILPETGPQELWVGKRDPYEVLGTPIYFYRPKNLVIRHYETGAELQNRLEREPSSFWLFQQGFKLEASAAALAGQCQPVYRTLPEWVLSINFTNWVERANVWSLYRCVAEGSEARSERAVSAPAGVTLPEARSRNHPDRQ